MPKNDPAEPSKRQNKVTEHKHAQLEQQVKELTEALQHERADAINIRRRAEEERLKMAAYYKASVVKELLPIIDSLDLALKHLPKDESSQQNLIDWADGMKKIGLQIEKVLGSIGVERIKTVGELFDPRFHEAVSMEPGDGTQEVVSDELQAGYQLGDEILRHAMVRVKMK
jgi:molecular chaperone GrpE